MGSDSTLHQKAREVVRAGKLPNRRPVRTWAGRGAGARCAACGEPVKPDEVEYELEFTRGEGRDGSGTRGDIYYVHLGCFEAWELEQERQEREATPGGDSCQRAEASGDATES